MWPRCKKRDISEVDVQALATGKRLLSSFEGLFEKQRSGKLASPTRKAAPCRKRLERLGFRCATRGRGKFESEKGSF